MKTRVLSPLFFAIAFIAVIASLPIWKGEPPPNVFVVSPTAPMSALSVTESGRIEVTCSKGNDSDFIVDGRKYTCKGSHESTPAAGTP